MEPERAHTVDSQQQSEHIENGSSRTKAVATASHSVAVKHMRFDDVYVMS